MHPQAFFVLGHRTWGKSHTLWALTGGITRIAQGGYLPYISFLKLA
jgi:hypothetical protein